MYRFFFLYLVYVWVSLYIQQYVSVIHKISKCGTAVAVTRLYTFSCNLNLKSLNIFHSVFFFFNSTVLSLVLLVSFYFKKITRKLEREQQKRQEKNKFKKKISTYLLAFYKIKCLRKLKRKTLKKIFKVSFLKVAKETNVPS